MRLQGRCDGRARRDERGSAIAEFALVSVVLVPLFLAVLQLALIWHVKSTLTAAASAGARHGAAYHHTAAEGAGRADDEIDRMLGTDLPARASAREQQVGGQDLVEVDVAARVPVLGFWGPTIEVEASGHAIKEVLP